MLEAEFDVHANSYRKQHQASVAFGGYELDYFARYKAAVARDYCASNGFSPNCIMDFGAGIGNSTWPLREAFPAATIKCVDVSVASLERCAALGVPDCSTHAYDGRTLPFDDKSIDLAFTACVFHHIPPAEHVHLLNEVRRCLKAGGTMILFEHNPLNPLTQLAVARCPFDDDAVLIGAVEMKRRFKAAGFQKIEVRYRLFFPGFLSKLRWLEPWIGFIPFGGQYHVTANA